MTLSNARRAAAVLLLLSLSPVIAYPQKTKPSPDEKPRTVKKELKKAYVDWIKDVDLILTTEDRLAWNKLKTDDEREQFIQLFWRQRDPDPDTAENEYKEQFYERVAYADEHFSSGKPGRMTDRGRIYIKFGKPDEIESHPAGGTYQRPSYEGGGSTSTYPFEKWFYRHIPNVRSGVELEFVDPNRFRRIPARSESRREGCATPRSRRGANTCESRWVSRAARIESREVVVLEE